MFLYNRQFYFRMGGFEVFAEGWERYAGEKLITTMRSKTEVSTDVQLWGFGVHLIVSRLRSNRCSCCFDLVTKEG